MVALPLGATSLASAQSPADTRPMTVEDVLALRNVGEVTISPDGRWVAYVVSERDMEAAENRSRIWVVAANAGEPYPLTSGLTSDRNPQWAPDGRWLAFLSDRAEEKKPQVYGISPTGGEAWKVTDWPTGVSSFRIAPDGSRIGFLATAKKSEADEKLEKVRGRPMVTDSAYAHEWSRLWVAPLAERRAEEAQQSSPDTLFIGGFAWSPDSRSVAWSARPSPLLRTNRLADVFVQDQVGSEPRRVTALPGGEDVVDWDERLGLVVSGSGQDVGTYNRRLWRVPADGGDLVPLSDGLDENAGYVGATSEALYVEATARTGRGLYRIPLRNGRPSGAPIRITDEERFYSGFTMDRSGQRVAFLAESATAAADVHVSALPKFRPRRLSLVNPQAAKLALGEQRVTRWRSAADGEEIEGVLTLPVGYRAGDRVPLLLVIHGGPSGVSSNRFVSARGAYPVQVFAGLGYAVLQPNYRGSTGYGERFRGLNRGDISGRDWIDVNSGVDHLIQQEIADPDRLGIMGWSFGGHHTFWGITQTNRFKAASAGAGATDLVSMYSQTDLPEFYHTYLGPRPWENFDLYEERSAYRFVDRVTTPLLIQVGEADRRVPAEQSIQFYEAIKGIGKAPVKLVLYPDQPHGIQHPLLQRDLMERNVAWFTRWIPIHRGRSAP